MIALFSYFPVDKLWSGRLDAAVIVCLKLVEGRGLQGVQREAAAYLPHSQNLQGRSIAITMIVGKKDPWVSMTLSWNQKCGCFF